MGFPRVRRGEEGKDWRREGGKDWGGREAMEGRTRERVRDWGKGRGRRLKAIIDSWVVSLPEVLLS